MKEERIGTPRRNLVIETAGSIRVLVGDKYYTLNFQDQKATTKDGSPAESNFIITPTIDEYLNGTANYPGDDKIIFALYSGIYCTRDNYYYLMSQDNNTSSKNSSFENTIEFSGTPAFKLNNTVLIENLNADYLDGYHASEFAMKSDLNGTLDKIKSSDGLFEYNEGLLEVPEINSDKINCKILHFDKLDGALVLGVNSEFTYKYQFTDGKSYNGVSINYDINLLSLLLNVYDEYEIEESIITLANKLFKPVNTNWTFDQLPTFTEDYSEEEFVQDLVDSQVYVAPILSSEEWNKKLSDGSELKDHILKYIYTDDLSNYDGAVFCLTVDNISEIFPGYKFSGVKVIGGEELEETNLVVTGINVNTNEIFVKSDWKTFEYINSSIFTETHDITDDFSIETSYYEYDGDLEIPEESLNVDTISDVVGYIGNYDGVTGDKFFLKLTQNGGFIGLDSENNPFLTIDNNGKASIKELDDLKSRVTALENTSSNFVSNRYITTPIIQFTKSADESEPNIMMKDSGLLSINKHEQTWWDGTAFKAVIYIENSLVENIEPTVIINNSSSDDKWWATSLIKNDSEIISGYTRYYLVASTIRPEQYASSMTNVKAPFIATIYGHFKLN